MHEIFVRIYFLTWIGFAAYYYSREAAGYTTVYVGPFEMPLLAGCVVAASLVAGGFKIFEMVGEEIAEELGFS